MKYAYVLVYYKSGWVFTKRIGSQIDLSYPDIKDTITSAILAYFEHHTQESSFEAALTPSQYLVYKLAYEDGSDCGKTIAITALDKTEDTEDITP